MAGQWTLLRRALRYPQGTSNRQTLPQTPSKARIIVRTSAATDGKFPLPKESPLPARLADYPELGYMGSKCRLLSWIHSVLCTLDFETASDPFTGSSCVAYLRKAMDKRVLASDFLNFPAVIASAAVKNSRRHGCFRRSGKHHGATSIAEG